MHEVSTICVDGTLKSKQALTSAVARVWSFFVLFGCLGTVLLFVYLKKKKKIQTRMTASVLKTRSKHIKGLEERYLLGQKHNLLFVCVSCVIVSFIVYVCDVLWCAFGGLQLCYADCVFMIV